MATGKGELMSAILFQSSMRFKYDEEIVVVVTLMIAYASVCAILAIVIQVPVFIYLYLTTWPSSDQLCDKHLQNPLKPGLCC